MRLRPLLLSVRGRHLCIRHTTHRRPSSVAPGWSAQSISRSLRSEGSTGRPRTVVRSIAPITWRNVPVQTGTNQSVVYSSGGRSRYAANLACHLGSVITAHAVHAPCGVDEEQMNRSSCGGRVTGPCRAKHIWRSFITPPPMSPPTRLASIDSRSAWQRSPASKCTRGSAEARSEALNLVFQLLQCVHLRSVRDVTIRPGWVFRCRGPRQIKQTRLRR